MELFEWTLVLLFIAVLLHKLPEGFTIASVMLASGRSRAAALGAGLALGVLTLLGAVLTRVFAQSNCFEPQRPIPNAAGMVEVTVPDSVQIVTMIDGGARGLYHISGITLYGPEKQIHLYGSRGTINLMTLQAIAIDDFEARLGHDELHRES